MILARRRAFSRRRSLPTVRRRQVEQLLSPPAKAPSILEDLDA